MDIHISIPFELLRERYLETVIKNRISVEISLKAEILDKTERKTFREVASILKSEAINTSIHLPFMDLSLAGFDVLVREISLRRLLQAMEIASIFSPKVCVFHSGFHPDYHREEKLNWRAIFIEISLPRIIKRAEDLGLKLALENTFEPEPQFMLPIFESFSSLLYWCFDPAHARVFSEIDELEWLQVLYEYLYEIHCHDNNGKWDEHLALGQGVIRFSEIFDFLFRNNLRPLLTIEAKKEEDALLSLQYLRHILTERFGK